MIPLERIHLTICNYYNVELEYIFKRSRKRDVVRKRQIFHYVAREINKKKISLETISKYYSWVTGHRYDHCTVLHSCKIIEGDIQIYPKFRDEMQDIVNHCRGISITDEVVLAIEKLRLINLIMNYNNTFELKRGLKDEALRLAKL